MTQTVPEAATAKIRRRNLATVGFMLNLGLRETQNHPPFIQLFKILLH